MSTSAPTSGFDVLFMRVDLHLTRIENVLNLFAGVLILCLMVLGVAQILGRALFNSPIFGFIDIVEFSIVGFAVLSISFVQRMGAHVRMELLLQKLHGRWLWAVELFGHSIGAFVVALLIPGSYMHFERAFEFGDSTMDIELITWPAKLIVPFALSNLLVRLILQCLGYARLLANPKLQPLGVAAVHSAAEVAAETVSQTETAN